MATFGMAYHHPLELIVFRYQNGAGYEPDCHARVALSDGVVFYASRFSERLANGVEAFVGEFPQPRLGR